MSVFQWCGYPVPFKPGETIAAALLRHSVRDFQSQGVPGVRGRVFCGIGACQACLVRCNGASAVEACLTPAEPGLVVQPLFGKAFKQDV